jgi:hypothetical protein
MQMTLSDEKRYFWLSSPLERHGTSVQEVQPHLDEECFCFVKRRRVQTISVEQ